MNYEQPEIKDLGSLKDLTLLDNTKDTTGSDGEVFGEQLGPLS